MSQSKTLKKSHLKTAALMGALLIGQLLTAGDGLARPPRPVPPGAGAHGNNGNHGSHGPHGPQAGRRAHVRPPSHAADARAYQMITQNLTAGGDCAQLGNSLRRLSNRIIRETAMLNHRLANIPAPIPGDLRSELREKARRRVLTEMLENTQFWDSLWDRLAEMYRSCDMTCFDDGTAIGEISGIGYCSASAQAGGLMGPGFAFSPSLPVCETAITVGCQKAYREAAQTYEGCEAYSSGTYLSTFREYTSQDCSLPES